MEVEEGEEGAPSTGSNTQDSIFKDSSCLNKADENNSLRAS